MAGYVEFLTVKNSSESRIGRALIAASEITGILTDGMDLKVEATRKQPMSILLRNGGTIEVYGYSPMEAIFMMKRAGAKACQVFLHANKDRLMPEGAAILEMEVAGYSHDEIQKEIANAQRRLANGG